MTIFSRKNGKGVFLPFILFALFLMAIPALARMETREDTSTEIQFYNRSIDIKSDGTFIEIIELQTSPLKEDGGEELASRPFFYDASTSDFLVLQAKTIYEGKEYRLDSSSIENKPIASTPIGFHKLSQVLVKYPHIKKGAQLYLKYKIRTTHPALPDFFATDFVYGQEGYWVSSKVRVTSEIPFFISKNDPENYLEIKESREDGKRIMEIQLKRPLIKRVIEESMAMLPLKNRPWVGISTAKDWADLAQKLHGEYEKLAQQPLPTLFQTIVTHASEKTSDIDKINAITSELATHIKYMGDWRSVYNHWYPRDLAKISDSGQGDCKDFSIATVAMLRKLGFQAHVALVERGISPTEYPVESPDLSRFNHVVVRVKMGDKIHWIDPTNLASFAQGTFPDISNRMALSLDPKALGKEMIPALTSNESEMIITEVIQFPQPDQITKEGQLELKGVSGLYFTGAGLAASRESLDNTIIRNISDESRILSKKVADYDLTSRIAHDLTFRYQTVEKHSELRTDAGPGYLLEPGYLAHMFLLKTQDRVSDIFIGTPGKFKKSLLLKGISRIQTRYKGCEVNSRWAKATRKVEDLKQNGVQITDTVETTVSLIRNEELHSEEFSSLQKQIEKCFNGVAIVYKPVKWANSTTK